MKYILESGFWTNEIIAKNLEEAKEMADEEISYNQESMTIKNEEGKTIAWRRWWGYEMPEEDDPDYDPDIMDDAITYGEFGFYTNWEEA